MYQQWRLVLSKEEVEGEHLEEPKHHGVEIVGVRVPINQGAVVEGEHQMMLSVHQLQYLLEVVEAVVEVMVEVMVVNGEKVVKDVAAAVEEAVVEEAAVEEAAVEEAAVEEAAVEEVVVVVEKVGACGNLLHYKHESWKYER